MDLRNNRISLGEILDNQAARVLIQREFPTLLNRSVPRYVRNMPLVQVMHHARGYLPQAKLQHLLEELEAL